MRTHVRRTCKTPQPLNRVSGKMRVSVVWLQQARQQLVPAYVVHPRVETVEADVQGYHWTGCRLLEGVPQAVREREASVDVSLFRREVLRSIIVAREFETPSKENGLPPRSDESPAPRLDVRILPRTFVSSTPRPAPCSRVCTHILSSWICDVWRHEYWIVSVQQNTRLFFAVK